MGPGLEDFVRPEFCVVGYGVDACYGYLVCNCSAGVEEVLGEIVDLSDLLFLRDAETSRGDP